MEDRLVRIAAVWLLPTGFIVATLRFDTPHDVLDYLANGLVVLFGFGLHDAMRDVGRDLDVEDADDESLEALD